MFLECCFLSSVKKFTYGRQQHDDDDDDDDSGGAGGYAAYWENQGAGAGFSGFGKWNAATII